MNQHYRYTEVPPHPKEGRGYPGEQEVINNHPEIFMLLDDDKPNSRPSKRAWNRLFREKEDAGYAVALAIEYEETQGISNGTWEIAAWSHGFYDEDENGWWHPVRLLLAKRGDGVPAYTGTDKHTLNLIRYFRC